MTFFGLFVCLFVSTILQKKQLLNGFLLEQLTNRRHIFTSEEKEQLQTHDHTKSMQRSD